MAYLTALPRTCFMASAHAAMLCSGGNPEYSLPGFAPLVYGWGWLLLGIIIGIVLTLLILYCGGCLKRDVPLATLAHIAVPPPPGIAQPPAQEVLNYIASGGRPALRELAAATGTTEADFLQMVFGEGPSRGVLDRR